MQILSKQQLEQNKSPNLYNIYCDPPFQYDMKHKLFEEQFMENLKHLANVIMIRNAMKKNDVIQYSFTPGAYHANNNKYNIQYFKPHLESMFGSRDKAFEYFKSRIQESFPGFKIELIKIYDWVYRVDINLNE